VKRIVIIPTYNEAENIADLVAAIREADAEWDILVVDDASPDGTGDLADQAGVEVLRRSGKLGLGTAYKEGFTWALSRGYEAIAQMDADFSHPPAVLPQLAAGLDSADLVIGSRYVPGGGTRHWGIHRQILSRTANTVARVLLGIAARDVTAGFRCYRRDVLEAIDYPAMESDGYAFQVEVLYRCQNAGFRLGEVPIIFVDRQQGTSKMNAAEILGGVANLLRLRLRRPS
jgi:glycosyltransferase involved in cell wall biosynthesis